MQVYLLLRRQDSFDGSPQVDELGHLRRSEWELAER